MKKIITNQDFFSFCDFNQILFKLPEEAPQKYYLLLNMYTSEIETGLSLSNNKIEQNWELVSDYQDSNGEIILVFEIWANKNPIFPLPGSVGCEHLGKRLEISLNQIKIAIQQFVNYNDTNSIWYHEKFKKTKILNKFIDEIFCVKKKDYLKFINYFKINGFNTIPYLLKILSYLPPNDRCIILNSVVEFFPYDINVYDKLSMALLKNGEFDKAVEVLDNAFNNQYLNIEYYNQLKRKIEFLFRERGYNFGESQNYQMAYSLLQIDMNKSFDLSWDENYIKAYNEFCEIMKEFCESQI